MVSAYNGRGRGGLGLRKSRTVVTDRIAEFARLRQYCTVAEAAEALGVTDRTAWRYEAVLKGRNNT